MAITTEGFKPQVFAQYTPVNPDLVAFAPQRFAEGIGSSFALAEQFAKIKAIRAQQAELAATRDKRIAATTSGFDRTIAQNAAEIPLFPKQAAYKEGELAMLTHLLPKQQAATEAGLDETINIAPSRLAAGIATNEQTVLNAPILGQAARAGAKADIAAAETAAAAAPLQRVSIMMGLADKIKNAKTDAERSRALEDAKLKSIEAETAENLAQAGYYDRGGASRAPVTNEARAAKIASALKDMADLPVSNGEAFKVYLNRTRNEDGSIKDPWFGSTELDPVGEYYFEQYVALQNQLQNRPGFATPLPQASSPSAPAAVQPKRMRFVMGEDGIELSN